MKTILSILLLTLYSLSTFSQSKVPDKITALNREMETDFNSNNMLKVAAMYLDSALLLGGGTNVTGRSNIDNYWLSLKDKGGTWKLEIDKIEDYGDIVIQRGRSYLSFGPDRQSNVRFILTWKRTGNSYKVLYDVYTRL